MAAYADVARDPVSKIEMVIVYKGEDGQTYERPLDGKGPAVLHDPDSKPLKTFHLDSNL